MRKFVPGPYLLLLLAVSLAASLSGCSAAVHGGSQPGTPPQPVPPSSSKETPTITWPEPAPITNPTPLSSTQLDATANVQGTFAYSPAAGTVLSAGTQTLSTTFTPTDTTDYNTATATVMITVNAAASTNPAPACSGTSIDANLAVSDSGDGRVFLYQSPLCTGMNAGVELGEAGFTSGYAPGDGPESASRLENPMGLSLDTAGNLYVADPIGGRVKQFDPPFASGMDASLELGMPDFTTVWYKSLGNTMAQYCGQYPPAASLCMPEGVTVDPLGNVWAADTWDGRVVEYQPPIQMAMDASLAIGQSDMSGTADCDGYHSALQSGTRPATASATELCQPAAVAFDESGNLWVADTLNNRVLEFSPPFSTGMAATLELGFPASVGMDSPSPFAGGPYNAGGTTAANFESPTALAFDSAGNLWVVDSGNSRVLEFSPPFTSGMAASLVLGQPNFNATGTSGESADGLNQPMGLSFDTHGDLIVADMGNDRVVVFVPPFSNGMSAAVVLGQQSLTGGCPPPQTTGCPTAAAGTLLQQPDGVLAY